MGNTALLYLIIITTAYSQAVLPHHNCSNVQSASSSDNNSSSDGMDDLVVVPLQYCIIDNSTIMRIDTGETLDIVYTTDSLMVVTPTDGHTSIVVPKNNVTSCLTSDDHDGQITEIVIRLIVSVLIAIISAYIVLVFLMLKEIRNGFGKLVMFHSCALVFQCGNNFMLMSVHYLLALHSKLTCQIIMFIYMQGLVAHEAFATCILAFLAYVMYCSINLREITEKITQRLFKKYLACVFGALSVIGFLIICYDFSTGNYKHLLLPDGHCAFNDIEIYNTLIIPYSCAVLNKIFQIILFVAYLYYFYKFTVNSAGVTNIDKQLNKKLTRIAFTFGITIGLSQFTWILGNLTGYRSYGRLIGAFFLLVQQCAVMVIMVCTKNVSQLCRKKLSSKIHPSS